MDHCFWRREDFSEYYAANREGKVAEGSKFCILATGVVRKTIMFQGQKKEITLNAIHTPDITVNLISISKLDASGYFVEFGRGKATFKKPDGLLFMAGMLVNSMYQLDFEDADMISAWVARLRELKASKDAWHRHLVCISNSGLNALISGKLINGLQVLEGDMDGLCEDCIFRKHVCRLFNSVYKLEKDVGDHVYMDLWGPGQVTGIGGMHWLIHLIDRHCGGPWVYFLAHKTAVQTLDSFKLFVAEVERQTVKKIKQVHVDGGQEWINELGKGFAVRRK
jgi:hypothetical protein